MLEMWRKAVIQDILEEYTKIQDWFISTYPGKEISLRVRYNKPEEKIEISISFTVADKTWTTAHYFETKCFKDKDYYGALKNGILSRNKRLIQEQIENT